MSKTNGSLFFPSEWRRRLRASVPFGPGITASQSHSLPNASSITFT
jgi:hypothetical protein